MKLLQFISRKWISVEILILHEKPSMPQCHITYSFSEKAHTTLKPLLFVAFDYGTARSPLENILEDCARSILIYDQCVEID